VDRVGSAMLTYALRWKDTSSDDTASLYVRTLAAVCVTWFDNERMLHIPSATSREIARLLAWLASDLRGASLERASAVTGLVPRTLQRRCSDELGMTWRELLREARMMRAVELLLEGHAPSAVARQTGFASTGAFVTAFHTRMGQPPGAFLRAIDSVVLPSPRPSRATHSRGAGARRTRTTRANRTTNTRTTGDRR
jgi:AraC-like DNA-binding protein